MRLIVLDAAGVPDGFSGERTRLRGLLEAYGRLDDAPELLVLLARGSKLLEGVSLGAVRIEEVARAGGPIARALRSMIAPAPAAAPATAGRSESGVELWHSETIPPLAPRGVPALLTLHDLRWHEPREATGAPWPRHTLRNVAARCWLPRVARNLAGIVTVSHASAQLIVERLRVSGANVTVVPNAIDVAAAAALPDETARRSLLASFGVETRDYFVAVGRLEGRKGLELAIDSLAAAGGARVPATLGGATVPATPGSAIQSSKLVLVGDGPQRDSLARRARERGVAGRVVFAGPRDDAMVAVLIAEAAALLFPSHVEGFGFPVHAALARSTPVIASELPCLTDLAASKPRGLTLLPRDVAAWSAALERALADARLPPPRAALPADAPTWNDSARKLAELYRRFSPARTATR